MKPYLEALWSRAALTLRLQPPEGSSVLWWTRSLSIDEARSLIRTLTRAVEAGQQHLNELQEHKKS